MTRMLTSLRKLIGRIQKHMANWFLSYAGTFVPLGIVLAIFAIEKEESWYALPFFILAIILIFAGIFALWWSWRLVKDEQSEKKRERAEDNKKFDLLMNELGELQNTFTKREETNDKPKPNDKPKQ